MTTRSQGDLHEHLEMLIRDARDTALVDLARHGTGDSAAGPIQGSRRILAAAIAALADVLDAHRPAMPGAGRPECPACGTAAPCPTVRRIAAALASYGPGVRTPLNRGAAWTRADAHFNRPPSGGPRRLVALADLGAFYVARGVRVRLPEPPRIPVPDTETVLLIDKVQGRMSRWPLLPEPDPIVQYRRYQRGEPVILNGRSTEERPARSRFLRRGTWTIPDC
jgi:hypothetical protein